MTWAASSELVMGFHATSRGFGWVVFDGASAPIDWGLTYARGSKNAACIKHLRILLERHRPEALVIEQPRGLVRGQAERMRQLAQSVRALAAEYGAEVRAYERGDIREALGLGERATRHEVAKVVADHIRAIRHRLPADRKSWESEDRRMALFWAAALALTHLNGL